MVIADAVQDAVAVEHLPDGRFYPGEPQGHAGLPGELEDLAHLRGPLRVDEVDSLAVKHDPGDAGRGQRDLPDPVLQGV